MIKKSFRNISLGALLGLLLGAMCVLLVFMSASALIDATERSASARQASKASVTSRFLFEALINLQLERGAAIGGLAAKDAVTPATVADTLKFRGSSERGYDAAIKSLEV